MWPPLLFLIFAGAEGLQARIIGGRPATVAQNPFMVSIQYNGQHHCGGSLISRRWVLTAAHCVYGKNPKAFKVRVGSTYSNKSGKLYDGISTIIIHERYDDATYEYDVALMQLPSDVPGSLKTKPIALAAAGSVVKPGSSVTVAGWGKTSVTGSMSAHLESVNLSVIEQAVCQHAYRFQNQVTPEMLCAGYMSGGKDTCRGDSGGPLVHNGVQIGIVSWGAECAKAGYPGVYTRVSAMRGWIMKQANV